MRPPARPASGGRGRRASPWWLALGLLALGAGAVPARAQTAPQGPVFAEDPDEPEPARQVTVFAVIATPDDPRADPKLAKVLPQLRKIMPNHGFRLLDVKSRRLNGGQSVVCNLGDGFTATTTLIEPSDVNGKVRLRCSVLLNEVPQLESMVTTPANQLFFCDKALNDGTRLLVGIGAR